MGIVTVPSSDSRSVSFKFFQKGSVAAGTGGTWEGPKGDIPSGVSELPVDRSPGTSGLVPAEQLPQEGTSHPVG